MEKHIKKDLNFVFFGTSEEAVYALEALFVRGFVPTLIVTPIDKPAGRKHILKSPLAKKMGRKTFYLLSSA